MNLANIKQPKITYGLIGKLRTVAEEGPITWHPTTPQNFSCEEGCTCCCAKTYYFPSEVENLPRKIQAKLDYDDKANIFTCDHPNGCGFDAYALPENNQYGCTIQKHKPLRCQLYPYWPVFIKNKIVIMTEPFMDVFKMDHEHDNPPTFRCYGLGRGKKVTAKIEKLSRAFLEKMVTESPSLLSGSLFYNTKDLLYPEYIEHYKNPKYETFREAYPELMEYVRKLFD